MTGEFPSNPALARKKETDDALLAEGEQSYDSLIEKEKSILDRVADYGIETISLIKELIEKESGEAEERLHEIRITLNGMMDKAGERKDANSAIGIKDLLEGMFGLDESEFE